MKKMEETKKNHVSQKRKYYILTKPSIWRNICAECILQHIYESLLLLMCMSHIFTAINVHNIITEYCNPLYIIV